MYSELNLDLQAYAKRTYDSILYQSTFYKCLNTAYIGELRTTGAPVIEVLRTKPISVHTRATKEIQSKLDPALVEYDHVMVDLTELNLDSAIRVPIMVTGSDVTNAIQDASDLKDADVAKKIDVYGYGKLAAASIPETQWAPSTKDEYINLLNTLKATLFNKSVEGEYRLGLGATEYANLVSALTSVLKFETLTGREGVDMGDVARAYGITVFEINDNVLDGVIGYFFNPIMAVGDMFMSAINQFPGTYPGYPGYYCIEYTASFGAAVVRPEAGLRLVEEVSA